MQQSLSMDEPLASLRVSDVPRLPSEKPSAWPLLLFPALRQLPNLRIAPKSFLSFSFSTNDLNPLRTVSY